MQFNVYNSRFIFSDSIIYIIVDIYVYFDKLKQSQHNGKTYLVATKVDLRKSDKNCVTDTEIKGNWRRRG
jgi:hypothetical protein